MTAEEFFAKLEEFGKDGIITLYPGPFMVRFGEDDRGGAKLLRLLFKHLTATTTVGKAETVLLTMMLLEVKEALKKNLPVEELWHLPDIRAHLMAWWWLLFFVSQVTEDELPPK